MRRLIHLILLFSCIALVLHGSAFAGARTAMAASASALSSSSPTASGGAYCKGERLHDYRKPLRSLPAIRRVPVNGALGLGGDAVRLSPLPSVGVGPGTIGFDVLPDRGSHAGRGGAWVVRVSLSRVRASGRSVISSSRTRVLRLASLSELAGREAGGRFHVSSDPAFYRVDMAFRQVDGPARKRFSEYFRVVERTVDVSLSVESASYAPGSVVASRIENRGTASVTFGYSFEVDQLIDGDWVEVLAKPAPGVAIEMFGGIAWGCIKLHLDGRFVPGRYRIRRDVSSEGLRSQRVLTAEFDVHAP